MIARVLKISVLVLCFLIVYPIVVYSQPSVRAGPAMYCGNKVEVLPFKDNYKETEFMVFQESADNTKPYYILYRNAKTGSWTFVVYNIPNAPSEIICLLHGGLTSYILPGIEDIKKMVEKQNKGLDKVKKIKEDKI